MREEQVLTQASQAYGKTTELEPPPPPQTHTHLRARARDVSTYVHHSLKFVLFSTPVGRPSIFVNVCRYFNNFSFGIVCLDINVDVRVPFRILVFMLCTKELDGECLDRAEFTVWCHVALSDSPIRFGDHATSAEQSATVTRRLGAMFPCDGRTFRNQSRWWDRVGAVKALFFKSVHSVAKKTSEQNSEWALHSRGSSGYCDPGGEGGKRWGGALVRVLVMFCLHVHRRSRTCTLEQRRVLCALNRSFVTQIKTSITAADTLVLSEREP